MLDNIFIKKELKQNKCEIEITHRIWELNEIKGADMFIEFRAWFRLLRLKWISNLNCVKFTTFIHILDKRKLTMKKIFKICMPFILFIVITSCNQGRIKELENQVSELESQLSEKLLLLSILITCYNQFLMGRLSNQFFAFNEVK